MRSLLAVCFLGLVWQAATMPRTDAPTTIKPDDTNNTPVPGKSISAVIPGQRTTGGCHYNGKTYQQNDVIKDECDLYCTCTDATIGKVTCDDMCPSYQQIPDACYFQTPPPGKCCELLFCPQHVHAVVIHYPKGYTPR